MVVVPVAAAVDVVGVATAVDVRGTAAHGKLPRARQITSSA